MTDFNISFNFSAEEEPVCGGKESDLLSARRRTELVPLEHREDIQEHHAWQLKPLEHKYGKENPPAPGRVAQPPVR